MSEQLPCNGHHVAGLALVVYFNRPTVILCCGTSVVIISSVSRPSAEVAFDQIRRVSCCPCVYDIHSYCFMRCPKGTVSCDRTMPPPTKQTNNTCIFSQVFFSLGCAHLCTRALSTVQGTPLLNTNVCY